MMSECCLVRTHVRRMMPRCRACSPRALQRLSRTAGACALLSACRLPLWVFFPRCPETLRTREQSAPRMIFNADPRGSGSDSISTTSGLLQQREPAGRRAPICGRGQFVKPASAHLCADGGFEDAIRHVGRDSVGLLYPTPRQRRECRIVRAGSQHPRDLVLVSACACSRSGRRRRVGEISPTTCVVAIGKTSVRVYRDTAHGPCGFNHMSDGRRRPLLGAPRQPVDRAKTNSAGRRAGGGRYSSNITLAGLETRRCKTESIWRWKRETKPARGAASISDAASSLDVQSLPERGSRVVSLLVKAVACISRETQLRNCYAWQTHRA
jgi:hypothetical protein